MIIAKIYNPTYEQVAEAFQVTVQTAEEMLRSTYSYDQIIGDNQVFLSTNADDPGDAKYLTIDSIKELSKDN